MVKALPFLYSMHWYSAFIHSPSTKLMTAAAFLQSIVTNPHLSNQFYKYDKELLDRGGWGKAAFNLLPPQFLISSLQFILPVKCVSPLPWMKEEYILHDKIRGEGCLHTQLFLTVSWAASFHQAVTHPNQKGKKDLQHLHIYTCVKQSHMYEQMVVLAFS